jgi:hypothetical protein
MSRPFVSPIHNQEETKMKIRTIAIATVLTFSTALAVAPAQAKHYRHHHHHLAMGSSTGPSGPRLDGGGVDKSRVGGQGVSRKASE